MTRMFYNCKDLDKSFSKWIINQTTATNDMFTGCTKYDKHMFNLSGKEKIGLKKKSSNNNQIGTVIKNSNIKGKTPVNNNIRKVSGQFYAHV
jgi:NADH/NAD ratio-sensing transcriptional regulator Rex